MYYEKEVLSYYSFHAFLEIRMLAFYSTRNVSLDYVKLRKFYHISLSEPHHILGVY